MIIRIIEKKREKDSEYQSFYLETKASLEQLEKQRMEVSHWNKKEKISIVTPLYHTPAIFLRELIESVLESSYENWQLCFADATQEVCFSKRRIHIFLDNRSAVECLVNIKPGDQIPDLIP